MAKSIKLDLPTLVLIGLAVLILIRGFSFETLMGQE